MPAKANKTLIIAVIYTRLHRKSCTRFQIGVDSFKANLFLEFHFTE